MRKALIICSVAAAILLSGCSNFDYTRLFTSSAQPAASSEQTSSQEVRPEIAAGNQNLLIYSKADGKIYTPDEIKTVYIPYSIQLLMSRAVSFDDVNATLPIKFNRNNGGAYYTYYKTAAGALYVFFDAGGNICTQIYLSDAALDATAFNGLSVGVSTFEDVAAVDKNAILYDRVPKMLDKKTPEVTRPISEHLLTNGDILTITYKKSGDKMLVESINTLPQMTKKYTDLILNIDK